MQQTTGPGDHPQKTVTKAGMISSGQPQAQTSLIQKTKKNLTKSSTEDSPAKAAPTERSGSTGQGSIPKHSTGIDTQNCTVRLPENGATEVGVGVKLCEPVRNKSSHNSTRNKAQHLAQNESSDHGVAEDSEAAAKLRDNLEQSIVIAWLKTRDGLLWSNRRSVRTPSILMSIKEDIVMSNVEGSLSLDTTTELALWWFKY